MNYLTVLAGLSREQKHELAAYGIPPQRLSDWKKGRRVPTPAQLATLAAVIGQAPDQLMVEVAKLRAKQTATSVQLDLFAMTSLDCAQERPDQANDTHAGDGSQRHG